MSYFSCARSLAIVGFTELLVLTGLMGLRKLACVCCGFKARS